MKRKSSWFIFGLLVLSISCSKEKSPEKVTQTGIFTDPRDKIEYHTVLIGDLWWMTENLNFGTSIDAFSGGSQQDGQQTDNQINEKYCYQNNDENCDQYGGLYQWQELMKYDTTGSVQGLCPDGWHVPSLEEFKILLKQYPSSASLNEGGSSGFEALLAGNKYSIAFGNLGDLALFWSSSGDVLNGAYYLLISKAGSALLKKENTSLAFSVRCVKNK